MAEKLRISCRAYGDLERGKYCFSSTALLFMMNMMEDEEVGMLLNGFQEQVELLENQDDDGTPYRIDTGSSDDAPAGHHC